MRGHQPVSVMHTYCFFPLKNAGFVAHHTWLMQRRLSVQNQDIAVLQVAIHLFVDRRSFCRETVASTRVCVLWCKKHISNGLTLFLRHFILMEG